MSDSHGKRWPITSHTVDPTHYELTNSHASPGEGYISFDSDKISPASPIARPAMWASWTSHHSVKTDVKNLSGVTLRAESPLTCILVVVYYSYEARKNLSLVAGIK